MISKACNWELKGEGGKRGDEGERCANGERCVPCRQRAEHTDPDEQRKRDYERADSVDAK